MVYTVAFKWLIFIAFYGAFYGGRFYKPHLLKSLYINIKENIQKYRKGTNTEDESSDNDRRNVGGRAGALAPGFVYAVNKLKLQLLVVINI